MTAHDLVEDLGRTYREGRLDRRMKVYLAPKLLIINEMGYLPMDELGATILLELVSARYERGSIVLTSNKSYGDWGSIFGDPAIATAILDRLPHDSTTINIREESYRLKNRRRAGLLPSRRQEAGPTVDHSLAPASAMPKVRRPRAPFRSLRPGSAKPASEVIRGGHYSTTTGWIFAPLLTPWCRARSESTARVRFHLELRARRRDATREGNRLFDCLLEGSRDR